MADFRIERKMIREGYTRIAGVDEVGRGALFGPVVAAAVILSEKLIRRRPRGWVREIDDSKLLSPARRKKLATAILANAASVGIGFATNFEIDQDNIYWASLKAMRRAVENLRIAPDFILVDGFGINNVNYPQRAIPKGDRKSITIASASIVAKVLRDEMMIRMDRFFEGYCLSKNKGYGTRDHYLALREKGPTLFHRLSFNLRCE
jgi:ribonuclease HII